MMSSQLDLSGALELLRSAVEEYTATGRKSYSAGLKPELRRRSEGAFDEKALGFETFRDFLRVAEAQQLVDIHPAPRGPDILLVPHGAALPVEPSTPWHSGPTRLRGDLWKAWVDWTPGYRRVYDRAHDRAERIPAVPADALGGPHRELAEALAKGSPDAIEIPGIPIERHLEWMHEFAAEDPENREDLLEALRNDRPAMEFASAIRRRPDVAAAWRRLLLDRVRTVIAEWAQKNELEIEMDAPALARESGHENEARATFNDASEDLEAVRRRVHHAVEQMSIAELSDLRIPLHALSGLFS